MTRKKRRVLIVSSEYGSWGEERIGPLETVDQAGHEMAEALEDGLERYGW